MVGEERRRQWGGENNTRRRLSRVNCVFSTVNGNESGYQNTCSESPSSTICLTHISATPVAAPPAPRKTIFCCPSLFFVMRVVASRPATTTAAVPESYFELGKIHPEKMKSCLIVNKKASGHQTSQVTKERSNVQRINCEFVLTS